MADWLSAALLLIGALFGLSGGLGLLRLPDVLTRLHAAAVTDTGCAGLMLLGLMVHAGVSLAAVKLGLILVFLLLTSPATSHALARAAEAGRGQGERV